MKKGRLVQDGKLNIFYFITSAIQYVDSSAIYYIRLVLHILKLLFTLLNHEDHAEKGTKKN